jgi:hypothetical protein
MPAKIIISDDSATMLLRLQAESVKINNQPPQSPEELIPENILAQAKQLEEERPPLDENSPFFIPSI